ncbi:MAG: homocysteine S-methyltransferase family protein [Planctomycetota bacterium]|jgi:methionine synthase I (cobalamin-dependent)
MGTRLDQLFPGTGPVLLDGAMGTALRASGWPVSEATVLANLRAPGMVATVHAAYRAVGARVLHTNTFGALPGTFASEGERLDAVRAGVRIARKAASGGTLVAGSLGAYDLAFHGPRLDEVVAVLVDEGVDLLVYETCNRAADARVALDLHAGLSTRLPLVVSASTTDGGREDRHRVEEIHALVRAAGDAAEFGLNCCRGPHEAFKVALGLPELPRWLKPNAGLPEERVDDNVMAAFARAACQRGARFVGGCCGTDAETLGLMAAALGPGSTAAP